MRTLIATLALAVLGSAHAAPIDDTIKPIQDEWAEIKYRTTESQQERRYDDLALKANQITLAHPGRAEPLIWEGIVLSSLAGAKGGLSGLSLVKEARRKYDEALAIDPRALNGSAHTSVGLLYYKVPGWPIGFGDKKKAEEHLRQALAINPDGIDANYFMGEYLFEQDRLAEARRHLEQALKAPPRPGRAVADEGRRTEIRNLLAKIPQAVLAAQ